MTYVSTHMYGVLNSQMTHTDVSNTERGAKNYATRNGYDKVSIRFNLGYHVEFIAQRINGKWYDADKLPTRETVYRVQLGADRLFESNDINVAYAWKHAHGLDRFLIVKKGWKTIEL